MDDSFGHWLAGFVDGEGCFVICRVTDGRHSRVNGGPLRTWPNCRFEITLRADDAAILRTIRDTLGFGNINAKQPSVNGLRNARTAAVYIVQRIGDCQRVVEFFTRYPLRAKKRAQFDVWAEAVHEMSKGRERDDAVIDDCRARLSELRQYVAPEWLDRIQDGNPTALKHRRDYGIAPACTCGCGGETKILSNPAGIPHPANPNYSAFKRGHYGRRLVEELGLRVT